MRRVGFQAHDGRIFEALTARGGVLVAIHSEPLCGRLARDPVSMAAATPRSAPGRAESKLHHPQFSGRGAASHLAPATRNASSW
jgi:hypothetical protein